ncbi:MAG: YbjN domain-containing protein [Xanthobacteraceae bacterium]
MSLIDAAEPCLDHPLAEVERMARRNNWDYSRSVEDELTLAIAGERTNYQASFSWMEDIRVLHFACAFEMKVPMSRLAEVQQLIGVINEQLWIGHFDVWGQNGIVMFRHALLLIGGVSTSERQCEAVLGAALDSCERYYPALQFVVWAGKSAREAMDATMFDTAGEA